MYGISDELKKYISESEEHMEETMEFYDSLEQKFQPIVDLLAVNEGKEFVDDIYSQIENYHKELDYDIELYTESFNERKEQLEEFVRESYSPEISDQLLAEIENMNIEGAQISTEELLELQEKIEEENEKLMERVEAFETLVKDIALSAAVVSLAEDYKKALNEKVDEKNNDKDFAFDLND